MQGSRETVSDETATGGGERQELNELTSAIIGAAIEVHRELGPGLLESTYEACLARELQELGLAFERQAALPARYKGLEIECGYRVDLLVDGTVIVELKAVNDTNAVHEAQLMSYLRLSGCKVGLLINLNVEVLRDGIKRIVNGF